MTRNETDTASEQTMNTDQSRGAIRCPNEERDRAARIRALNGALRTTGRGGNVLMTESVAALGSAKVDAIRAAIARFDAFTPDNDPYGEHDLATLDVEGLSVIWKVDYYDRTLTYHSPDPACPKLTLRVLTIMLASDY
jgi:hypothetical protein